MDTPDLRHIVVTWDLDEGTGLAVRYGEMPPARAALLLELAAKIVAEHAELLEELDDDDTDEEVDFELAYDEAEDDYPDDDE